MPPRRPLPEASIGSISGWWKRGEPVRPPGGSHAERIFFEAFLTKVQNTPEGTNRTVLHALCDLFALAMIEEDRAWFMEHGRLSTERSKAVTGAVEQLCRQLRPHAEDLVDAFGVPADLLRTDLT